MKKWRIHLNSGQFLSLKANDAIIEMNEDETFKTIAFIDRDNDKVLAFSLNQVSAVEEI